MKEKIFCKECNTQTNYVLDSFFRYHLKKEHNMTMREYYDKHFKKEGEGICKECGKPTTIRRFNVGYRDFCSVQCTNKNKEVRKKMSKSHLNKTPEEKQIIIKKREQTNIEKFGVSYYSELDETKKIKRKKMLNKDYEKYKELFEKQNITIKEVLNSKLVCTCNECNNDFVIQKQMINKRVNRKEKICIKCNPLKRTNCDGHLDIITFIKEIDNNIIIKINDRKIIKPLELDIYLPDFNLAIEYNGLYWHSELNKDTDYHLNKTEKCLEKGIKLIHIYEDDWIYKKDIIKSRILNLLGKSERIYARKCIIKEVYNNISKNFLEKNHIQGGINSKYSIGLYYNNELVSLMTFSKSRYEKNKLELLRFCNKLNTTVIGGASRLFKYFINNYDIYSDIVSYADRSWGDGNLYKTLNFELIKKTKPNYSYIVNGIKDNRFKYRKSELIKDGYDKNKTEHEIMMERCIYRIYNSGNLKYLYKIL